MRRLLASRSLLLFRAIFEVARNAGFNGAVNKDCDREILAAVEADLNNQVFFRLQRSVRIA